jgi:4-amino-4-deoxy-L-arabinose transferase-like glycosyltransferase
MNPVFLYFASGDSLYTGAGLLLLAVVISRYLRERRWLRLRNLAAWLGLALMVMACPPFSWVVDAIILAAFSLWLIAANQWLGWSGTELAFLVGCSVACCGNDAHGLGTSSPENTGDSGHSERSSGGYRRFDFFGYRFARAGVASCHAAID